MDSQVVTISLLVLLLVQVGNGELQTLKEWIDSNNFTVHFQVYQPFRHEINHNKEVQEHTQLCTMKVGKHTNSQSLTVFGGKSEEKPNYEIEDTHYLEVQPNHATFQCLDQYKWGRWFITSTLSGCDVYVAHSDGFEPVIIHVNANEYCNKDKNIERCWEKKYDMAIDALTYINSGAREPYKLIKRVSSNVHKYYSTSKWKNWAKQVAIQPCLYSGLTLFYGTYTDSGKWDFELRDLKSGKKLSCIDVDKTKT